MPLAISAPPPNTVRLRFVTTKRSITGRLIRLRETEGPVSHAEAVMEDGSIIGAYSPGGVLRQQPNDFDKASTLQIFVDLPMESAMYEHWKAGLEYRVAQKWQYDQKAILGFIFFDGKFHDAHKAICSALQVDILRHCKWWTRPLAQKYHSIDPLTLLLMCQADERTIIHPPETIS
ncbi:MAG: hypothetical protein WDN46_15215 [Methylocella sp.]